MNKGVIYWLRWSAVLPGAFLAAVIVTLVIRQILFYTVFVFFPLNYPVESGLVPLLNAAGFIYFGILIAPERTHRALVIVFTLCRMITGVFVYLTVSGAEWQGYKIQVNGGWVACMLAMLGACFGASLVKRKLDNEER